MSSEPYFGSEPEMEPNLLIRLENKFINFFDRPVTWFRESIVTPNQQNYKYYHYDIGRVPNIDKCNTDDDICIYEAQEQFMRDRRVESEMLKILRRRADDCYRIHYPDTERCKSLMDGYWDAEEKWFIKYGDLGAKPSVITAYMKQKHRMLWERRHGKVGTGMKNARVTTAA